MNTALAAYLLELIPINGSLGPQVFRESRRTLFSPTLARQCSVHLRFRLYHDDLIEFLCAWCVFQSLRWGARSLRRGPQKAWQGADIDQSVIVGSFIFVVAGSATKVVSLLLPGVRCIPPPLRRNAYGSLIF